MTVLENRFMESAIAFFNRHKAEKCKFIELTMIDGIWHTEKVTLNKDNIVSVRATTDNKGEMTASYITLVDMASIIVTESYGQVKSMLL